MQPSTATDRFAYIIDSLFKAVAAGGAGSPNRHHGLPSNNVRSGPTFRSPKGLTAPLLILICNKLRRMAIRFAVIAAQIQAGTRKRESRAAEQRAPRPSGSRPAPSQDGPLSPCTQRSERDAKPRLPTRFAWLLRLVPGVTAGRSQFIHFLSTPDVLELLAAAPQLGRMFRGLCRMLGIKLDPGVIPPALIPPKRPRQRKPQITPLSPFVRSLAGPHSRKQPPGSFMQKQESSHTPQCAGPDVDVDPKLLALHEEILRWAETRPDPGEPCALIPMRQRFKPA